MYFQVMLKPHFLISSISSYIKAANKSLGTTTTHVATNV